MSTVEQFASTLTALTLKNNWIRRFDLSSNIIFDKMRDIDISYNQIQYLDWRMLNKLRVTAKKQLF